MVYRKVVKRVLGTMRNFFSSFISFYRTYMRWWVLAEAIVITFYNICKSNHHAGPGWLLSWCHTPKCCGFDFWSESIRDRCFSLTSMFVVAFSFFLSSEYKNTHILRYALNLHSDVCQLFRNKTGKNILPKQNTMNSFCSHTYQDWLTTKPQLRTPFHDWLSWAFFWLLSKHLS